MLPFLLGVAPFGLVVGVAMVAGGLSPAAAMAMSLRRALPFVPAAVLTAVWAPELLLQKGVLYLSLQNERLLAGGGAILVAWRWRLTFATIASGLLALHFFDWLL